ncbi:MAG: hypothetical protein ABSA54_01310 [Terriglobales bacterium]|jgi:hypothetical protein
MSTVSVNSLDLLPPPVTRTIQHRSLVVGVVFGIISALFAFFVPDQFFRSYLLGYMVWLGLTLGCIGFLMLLHMTGGAWGLVIRRMLEAGTRTLPLMVVLFVPVVLGLRRLYVWTHADAVAKDERVKALTQTYLTSGGFIGRAILYFAIWGFLVYLLNRWSAEQDNPPTRDLPKLRKTSAAGLILYAFAMSFAAIDWVMSLTPPWISTIYAMIYLVGQCLAAMCFMVVVETILHRYKPISMLLKPREVQDHGKLMLTFVMLWAYFSFSQLLIIWSGNLPDEISFYVRRFHGGWQVVGLFLAAFHFALPFLLLLSRNLKRNPRILVWVALWLMFMRYVNLYWFIEPNFHQMFYWHWLDGAIPIAIGGFWLALFFHNLQGHPLLPLYAPRARALLEPAHD